MDADPDDATVISTGWPDRLVGELAARQRTMVLRAQLLEIGVSSSAIDRTIARGRLFRTHRGVYSTVAIAARPPWADEMAAILACGPAAALSHQTAARLHGLTVHGSPQPIHVTVVGSHRKPSHRGIVVHATTLLTAQEHHRLSGMPVTSVARTVIDLSPTLAARAREVLVDEALRKTSRTKLLEALQRHAGRPGTPALRALLEPTRPSSLTWSEVEERLLLLIRQAGLPSPECNVALTPRYTPDLLWREQRVIIEYDSDEFHSGPRSARRDDARHNELAAAGYAVLHITKTHVPVQTLVWLARALALAERRAGA